MPGQFVLEGGRASIEGSEEGASIDTFDEYVAPVKFVHNVFFGIDGSAEVWCELELGNNHPEHALRIDEVHVGFNDIGQGSTGVKNIGPAETSYTDLDDDEVPLLLESTGAGDTEQWQEMYDEYRRIDDDSSYFSAHEAKNSEGNDRIFEYRLGPGEPHQHIYSVPVTFDVESSLDEGDTAHSYLLTNIRKLTERGHPGADSPVILTNDQLSSQFPGMSRFDNPDVDDFDKPTRIDTISLWIYWEEDDLCVPKDDISYHFRYAVDCDVKEKIFSRVYPHYILPEKSVLMGRTMLMESLSEEAVEEFHPPESRWMFKEWEERYNVRDMSSARMTRAKAKQKGHVFNSGRIGFPALRARHTMLQFILVILSGWAVQAAFSGLTMEMLTTSPFPFGTTWPLLVLPLSAYLLTKGYGPPPFFPESLRGYIVPTERYALAPANKGISALVNLPLSALSACTKPLGNLVSAVSGALTEPLETDGSDDDPGDSQYGDDP